MRCEGKPTSSDISHDSVTKNKTLALKEKVREPNQCFDCLSIRAQSLVNKTEHWNILLVHFGTLETLSLLKISSKKLLGGLALA